MNMDNKCKFCDDDFCNKDIFLNWLPAMFGIEREDHEYNPDVTVCITDDAELELRVMMGNYELVSDVKKIKYCPFCGRILDFKNDNIEITSKIYDEKDMTAIAEVHAKDERLAKIAVNSILRKLEEEQK